MSYRAKLDLRFGLSPKEKTEIERIDEILFCPMFGYHQPNTLTAPRFFYGDMGVFNSAINIEESDYTRKMLFSVLSKSSPEDWPLLKEPIFLHYLGSARIEFVHVSSREFGEILLSTFPKVHWKKTTWSHSTLLAMPNVWSSFQADVLADFRYDDLNGGVYSDRYFQGHNPY